MRLQIFTFCLLSCFHLQAQWSSNASVNNAICAFAGHQMDVQVESDGNGGAFVVWRDSRNLSGAMDIYAQRISASGILLWNADGVAICNAASDQFAPRLVPDGSGGAIIAWFDNRAGNYDIYAQRINSSGLVQWTTDGVAVCTASGNQNAHQLMPDGSGGAFIVWCDGRTSGPNADIYGQRINGSGIAQWTADGVTICNAASLQNIPQLTTDGGTGFIVSWEDWRNFSQTDIYAQRVSSNGFTNWSFQGVVICSEPNFAAQYNSRIVSDGSGGAIICWQDKRTSSSDDIYAQRINNSGVVQWANNGVVVCNAAGLQINSRMISHESGGAIICWEDRRAGQDIYAQLISASGTSQWTANGVAVCNDGSNQIEPQMINVSGGGAIISWSDYRNSGDVYAQKLNSTGVAQWAANGVPVSNATNEQAASAMIADGSDNAIIVWRDLRTANDYDIYGSRLLSNGTLPVHLFEFRTTQVADIVKLQWKTSNETNNTGFDIERSANGIDWMAIGFVAAQSSGSAIQQYYWNDNNPLAGRSYYRLKQKDFDGRFEYSKTLLVDRGGDGIHAVVYPNPARETVNINFGRHAITGTAQIITATGQLVFTKTFVSQLSLDIDIRSFSPGIYNLMILSEKGRTTRLVRIQ